jgi:hypothetical protein
MAQDASLFRSTFHAWWLCVDCEKPRHEHFGGWLYAQLNCGLITGNQPCCQKIYFQTRRRTLMACVFHSFLVHERTAVCKLSKARLPDNTPDQIQVVTKPVSWFLWATLIGFPFSLHCVISCAWMTWMFSLADTTFVFKLPPRGVNWFTLWRVLSVASLNHALHTWKWICVRQHDNTNCFLLGWSHFWICAFGRWKRNYFPTMTERNHSEFISWSV